LRILIASNLYPPHHQGGYELRCAQVVEHLQRVGHSVRVVSSDYEIRSDGHGARPREDSVNGVAVSRFLRQHRLDPRQPGGRLYFLDVARRQIADLTRFREILDDFKPDLVSWWNLEGVSKAVLCMSHDRGIPGVYCIDDNWMIREFGADGNADLPFWFDFWAVQWGPSPVRPLVRLLLSGYRRRLEAAGIPTRPFRVPPGHMCFISEYRRHQYREAHFEVGSSDVIYGGVSVEEFLVKRSPADYAHGPLRLLYAGYVDLRRGLHTIIEALALLPAAQRDRVHLSVAQGGPVVADEYVNGIHARIKQLGLSSHVTFLGRVPHDEMPAVYAAHDVLVFTSTMNEGMPMVMMEAMCSGCAVPNTGSGGAIELAEKADAPLFPKDHPFALGRLISALEKDRFRVAEIALRGQQTVLREFTIERMLERTCDVFTRAAARNGSSEPETVAVR
jgi:glycosyltransferase involved in cell wall biosynthesis